MRNMFQMINPSFISLIVGQCSCNIRNKHTSIRHVSPILLLFPLAIPHALNLFRVTDQLMICVR